MNDFDKQWNDERKELADLEYTEPIVNEEDELEEEICTCEIDKYNCLIHPLEEPDEEE